MIRRVNDAQQSIDFHARILGLHYEGERGPFAVIRVTEALALQLAPWTTPGGEHLPRDRRLRIHFATRTARGVSRDSRGIRAALSISMDVSVTGSSCGAWREKLNTFRHGRA